MIHTIMAIAPVHGGDARSDRDFYSAMFVTGCVIPLLLAMSERLRDWCRWFPGGVKMILLIDAVVIAGCVMVLR